MADSTSTVAPGFEGYIGDMLSRGWGLSQLPYAPYTGQRYAFETPEGAPGYSPLETAAFTGLGSLQVPGTYGTAADMAQRAGAAPATYTPGQFSTGLGPVGSVQDYMNPYLQSVVDVQAREARRQSDIGGQADQAKFAQAGAFGGARDAIMRAERERNLQTQIGDIQAKGLMSAFDAAQKQRMGEATLGLEGQRLGEVSRQFGAGFGLQGLQQQLAAARGLSDISTQQTGAERQLLEDQMKAGSLQRGIAQQPLDFGYQQFQESLNQPFKGLSTMQSLLSGMPITAQPYQPGASTFGAGLQGGLGGLAFYNLMTGNK